MAEPIEIVKKNLSRKGNNDNAILDYGKIPPQSVALEKVVLGALMIEDCIVEVATILKPDHFYMDSHRRIYSAIIRLFGEAKPIDLLTVSDELKKSGDLDACGGHYYIAQLTNTVGSAANVETHALIVKEAWIKREVIQTGSVMVREGFEDTSDPLELLEKAQGSLDLIVGEIHTGESQQFPEALKRQIEKIEAAAAKPNEDKNVIGLPTGIYSLDRKVLGWTAPDMIVLAGRPGEGKTTEALQTVDACCSKGIPVGMVSLEMKLDQLILKLISLNTDIPISKLRTGKLTEEDWVKVYKAQEKIRDYPFYVYDKPCTPEEMKSIFKTWHKKYGIKMGIVDYIQRMQVPKYMRDAKPDAQITVFSNAIKDTCLYLNIPIVALSQMSREVEGRKGEQSRPQLTDLRGSGSLEQDADIVIFVFRPEIHNIKNYEDGSSTTGCTEFIVKKHRLGTLGTIKAKFIGHGNRFDDADFNSDNAEANKEKVDDDLPF